MKELCTTQELAIPSGIDISVNAREVTVTGPRGTLTRSFKHINADIYIAETDGGKKVVAEVWFGRKKQRAVVRTITSHIENMITGVTKGYRYKMRFVYAHFPVNFVIADNGSRIEIRNFLGEKVVRHVRAPKGVEIISSSVKDEIWIEGNDVEQVSRTAALIHQSILVKNKDIRKFLDGAYVSEKGTIVTE